MKRFLTTLLLLLSVSSAYAQTDKPLSKKETKELVAQLKDLVSVGDDETAIKVYKENERRIDVKSIAKGDREWWEATIVALNTKEQLFNSNQTAIDAAKKLYSNQEYWRCNEAISGLKLDRSCARLATLRQFNDLSTKMQDKQIVLQTVDGKMPEMVNLYNKKDAEQLFWLFFNELKPAVENNGGSIRGYVDPQYLPAVNAIINEYEALFRQYCKVFSSTVTEPTTSIMSIVAHKDMGRNNATQAIEQCRAFIKRIEQSEEFKSEGFPILAQQQTKTKEAIGEKIAALQTVLAETDPVKAIMGGGAVTLSQIKGDCSIVDDDFVAMLKMDVGGYYHKRLVTDLQVQMYKESDEYKEQYKELQELRRTALNSVYYSTMSVNSGAYSLKDGAFNLKVGGNMAHLELLTPLNLIGEVVHESLPINSVDRLGSNTVLDYYLKIPVSKEVAVNYENRKCELVFCFIPAGVKIFNCTGFSFGAGKMTGKKEYPYSTKCRVFLFTKDGELIADKLF